jgi:hypothetical protein
MALAATGCRSTATQTERPARTPAFIQAQATEPKKTDVIQASAAESSASAGVTTADYSTSSYFGSSCSH